MKKSFVGSRVIYRGSEVSLRDRRGTVISENISGVQVVMDTSQVGRGLVVSVKEGDLIFDEFVFQNTEELSDFIVSQFRKSRPIIPVHSHIINTPVGEVRLATLWEKESNEQRITFINTEGGAGQVPGEAVAMLNISSAVECMFGKIVSRPVLKAFSVNSRYELSPELGLMDDDELFQ